MKMKTFCLNCGGEILMESLQEIFETKKQIKELYNNLFDLVKEAFPVGSALTFKKGNHVISAQVLGHVKMYSPGEPELKILSHTGKCYTISLFDALSLQEGT